MKKILRVRWQASGRDEIDYDSLAELVESEVRETVSNGIGHAEDVREELFDYHLRQRLGISTAYEQDFSLRVNFSFDVSSYEKDVPNMGEFYLGKLENDTDGLFDVEDEIPIDFKKPLT